MITINNEDYDYALVLPISEHYALDESLDNAVIRIDGIERAERFEPYTVARVNDYDYYIAKDTVKKIVGTNLYNHTIALIELTKITEKYIIDTNTVTQPKERNYDVELQASVYCSGTNDGIYKSPHYKAFYLKDTTITTQSLVNHFLETDNPNRQSFGPTVANLWTTITYNGQRIQRTNNENQTFNITLDQIGTLTITYMAGGTSLYPATDTINIGIIEQAVYSDNKTITDVVNKLCELTKESRFNSAKKRDFVFNNAQATEYANEIAPEFSFTKCTLWEALSQVGGYIHAIPRIELGYNVFIVYNFPNCKITAS